MAQHVRALMKTEIWRAPKLLMVQLKRFTHTNAGYSSYGFFGRGAGLGEKVSTPVDFPIRGLKLDPYVACKGWPGAAKDEGSSSTDNGSGEGDGDSDEGVQEGAGAAAAAAAAAATASAEVAKKVAEGEGEKNTNMMNSKKDDGEEEKKEGVAKENKVTPEIYKMAEKAAVQREKPGGC